MRITVSTGIGVSQTCTTSAGCRQILIAVSQEETYTISFRAFSLILVEGDVQAERSIKLVVKHRTAGGTVLISCQLEQTIRLTVDSTITIGFPFGLASQISASRQACIIEKGPFTSNGGTHKRLRRQGAGFLLRHGGGGGGVADATEHGYRRNCGNDSLGKTLL